DWRSSLANASKTSSTRCSFDNRLALIEFSYITISVRSNSLSSDKWVTLLIGQRRLPRPHSLRFNAAERGANFFQLVGGEFNGSRSQIFFQMIRVGSAGNGHNKRFLRQQPAERELHGSNILAECPLADEFNKRLVGFDGFGAEKRDTRAAVFLRKPTEFVVSVGEIGSRRRSPRHETDAKFFAGGDKDRKSVG